jgi:mannose-1-phosphate guanylyltransferase
LSVRHNPTKIDQPMLHALLMAGGSGTRFWPESRRERPKQLLPLVDERSMLRTTVDRIAEIIAPERLWPAVGAGLVPAVRRELPEIAEQNYVVEPCQRNTAPCIGLAALRMLQADPDAVMLVLPADHAIADIPAFHRGVKLANQLASKPGKPIVTFGIKPTYPSEGFGYIERGEKLALPKEQGPYATHAADIDVYQVARFREKPKLEQAREFLESGKFYWNSGMFLWRADVIVDALRAHQPEMLQRLERIAGAYGTASYEADLLREFPQVASISIDYAVMEHARNVMVVESPFDWDDVGSWGALERLRGADADGNTVVGRHLGVDTVRSIVRTSDGHLVVTLGMKDCIVVHTADATLVADRSEEESIRKVVDRLQERGWNDVL